MTPEFLNSLCRSLKPLPADKILRVIKAVASALDYLHTEKHLIHGDLVKV